MSKPQLFCFTCAGGKADLFTAIENDLPEAELIKPEYPGHGIRHKEPLCTDFSQLADEMFAAVRKKYSGGSYGLFGYSMGSVTLAEVLVRILGSGMAPPVCVFLAAHPPVNKPALASLGGDDKVKERTVSFGAVPKRLADNKSFWRIYLPILRADFNMIGRYRFERLCLKTDIPAAVFYSETDTPHSAMLGWKEYFAGECGFYEFPGEHFFIDEHHAEMADIIRRMLIQKQ